MKLRFAVAAVTIMTIFFTAASLLAHHSNAAQFDSTKRQTIKGEVSKVEWTNPHAWIHLNVKDASGKVTTWELEGFPPNTLLRTGWSQKDLKEGDTISVEGALARDGSPTMLAREVTLVDGRKLYWGPAA